MNRKYYLILLLGLLVVDRVAANTLAIPVANFSADHTSICEGQCVNFTDLSSNNPTSWSWSFQGASVFSSSQQNPSGICYFTAGTYFVSLTVSNASGSNTLYLAGYITVYPSSVVNLLPNGDFNNYNTSFTSQLTYLPTGSLSPDQYTIDTNAWYHNGNWAGISPDSTPFFMSDGSLTSGRIVWSENLATVFPSSDYTFSFLMTNLDVNHTFVQPELQTTVTDQAGTVLLTGTTGLLTAANSNNPPVYVWTPFNYIFATLPNTTSITITLSQVGGTYLGFDFGLEDLNLKTHFCDSLAALPVSGLFSDESTLCPGTCAGFMNLSVNATSYIWMFPGGTPAVSTDVNPQAVCYNTPGSYDVTLIAANAAGSDTVTISGYITVLPFPPAQGIAQNGDTLMANQGAVSYQWFYNGSLIPGATNYFYVAGGSGNFNVIAIDSNGCEVEAVIYDVVAGMNPVSGDMQFKVFPNPVTGNFAIRCEPFFNAGNPDIEKTISIYNVLGEKVYSDVLQLRDGLMMLNGKLLHSGIYWLEIMSRDQLICREKIIKE